MLHYHIAQINPTVGAIDHNYQLIANAYAQAKSVADTQIVIFPELAITGYPPEDLLLTPSFIRASTHAIEQLALLTLGDNPAILIGAPHLHHGKLYNAAYLLDNGTVHSITHKHHLPNDGVFDEVRYFSKGALPYCIAWRNHKLGIMICEDMWHPDIADHLASQGCEYFITINASPFDTKKADLRLFWARQHTTKHNMPLLYVNLVGGQDELVFDGGSFVMDSNGQISTQLPFFESCVACEDNTSVPSVDMLRYQAMMLGLRDYVEKNNFKSVVLGLSGGIDSALTAAVAVDALGADRVHAVMMPSPYTSQLSLDEARITAENLGIRYDILPITQGMEATTAILSHAHDPQIPCPIALENIQARLRGLLLMAISNSTGALLLTTGNKSEMAVGYATLYGDMCGAFSVLKDIYKTDVFALARWRNHNLPPHAKGKTGNVIPDLTISRPPSAELRENQTDQDSLPPYDVLDAILKHLIEEHMDSASIIAKGFDEVIVKKVARLLTINEYKRRQAPPGVKLTTMNFGKDRRFPLTNRFQL